MAQTQPQIKSLPDSVPSPNRLPRAIQGPVLIVFGNEKGGSGKSTAAMHTAIALLRRGYRVGTIDLDARQGTLTRYLRNRFLFVGRTKRMIPQPLHMAIERSAARTLEGQKQEDMGFLAMAMDELGKTCDFIVIDTPGADTHLSRLAHGLADVLVTPMNDSPIDLDVLASIDPATHRITGPSFYTRHVSALIAEKERQLGRKTDWIVMRNRLSTLASRSKSEIHDRLTELSSRHGFKIASGFSERLAFRDLFLEGLTLVDLPDLEGGDVKPSHMAALREINDLMKAIDPAAYKPQSGEELVPHHVRSHFER